MRVAVMGAGLLGIDLVRRICGSPLLDCVLVVGGGTGSTGLRMAAELGCPTSTSVDALADAGTEVIFDASNATVDREGLVASGVLLVDLTPRSAGTVVVPTVNGHVAETDRHLSLVSCGGQAALPVLDAVTRRCGPLEYVEVVTTAAAASVGRATRLNLDEYISTTTSAVRQITKGRAKVLVNLTPALPAPPFRVEIAAVAAGVEQAVLRADVEGAAQAVRVFAPGYEVVSCGVDGDLIRMSVVVTAEAGRHLPGYAGNIEIINRAAVLLAERHATARGAAA